MPNKIPIYTIQFLDISFNNRNEFLNHIHKHVFEIALQQQQLFKEQGCDAEYFHTNKVAQNNVPKLINCFIHENVFTIRAYTKKGVNTLKFWYKLYKKIHPTYCKDVRKSKETYTLKAEDDSIYTYSSKNWVAFNNVKYKDKKYYENGNIVNFRSKIIGHIRTFLRDLEIDNSNFKLKIALEKEPTKHQIFTALQTVKGVKLNPIKLFSFNIQFSTNYKLPQLFSMGKKVGYGTGVFMRDNSKTIYHETPKVNAKPIKKE